MKSFKIVLLGAVLLSLTGLTGYAETKVVDKNIALVNGETIMLSDFDKIWEPILEQYKTATPANEQTVDKINKLKQRVLDQMIDDKILKQEANKQKIRVSKRDLDEGMEQIKKRFPSEVDFQKELRKEAISQADFENKIKEQIMVMKLTEQAVKATTEKPSDEDAKKLYTQIFDKLDGKQVTSDKDSDEELTKLATFFKKISNEQIRARHILVTIDKDAGMKEKTAALNKIKEAKKKLDDGVDFAKVAQEYSQDPGSAQKGGDLGYFTKGDMVPEFEKTAFSLNVGQVSNPVLTEFGYHIIKVEEKKAAKKVAFEDVKEDLQQYLYQKSAQKKYESWIKDLKSKATIKTNEF